MNGDERVVLGLVSGVCGGDLDGVHVLGPFGGRHGGELFPDAGAFRELSASAYAPLPALVVFDLPLTAASYDTDSEGNLSIDHT